MNHMERFYASIERKHVDRQASWLGLPAPEAEKKLIKYLNVKSIDEVKKIVDDDIYTAELPYHSPTSNAIYSALNFSKKDSSSNIDGRTLTAPGFFEDYSDPEAINDFDWPDPSKYINVYKCREAVEVEAGGRPIMGVVWSAHFQDACSAFEWKPHL